MGESLNGITFRDYVDARDAELHRRLDESLADRERLHSDLRTTASVREVDVLRDRVSALERLVARLLGGLGVVVALLGFAGLLIRLFIG